MKSGNIATTPHPKRNILSPGNYNWILAGIMIVGCAVRIWKFGAVPGGFNQDGAMMAVDALALSEYGTDRFGMPFPAHLTAWGYGQMSALLSYLTIPFASLWGLHPIAVRLPVLIMSIIGLWVLFLLVKDLFGKGSATVVLFFAAINPWHIMQSRWALDCNLLPHFMLLSVFFLNKSFIGQTSGSPKKTTFYAYLAMIFFALAMYCYGIAWYFIPLFLVISGGLFLKRKILTGKQIGICVVVYLLFAWPIIGVMIVNTFKLPALSLPFVTIPFFPDSVRSNDLLFFSEDFFGQLIANVDQVIKVVILQRPDTLWNTVPAFGAIYLFSIPFTCIGIFQSIRTKSLENKNKMGLIMIWLCLSILSGLMVNNINVNRINIIYYPLIIFTGVGIYQLLTLKIPVAKMSAEKIPAGKLPATKLPTVPMSAEKMPITKISAIKISIAEMSIVKILSKKYVLATIIIGLYLGSFITFSYTYFGSHNERLSEAFYDGFGQSLQYADQSGYDRIYITKYTGYDRERVSEILTQFHLQLDSHYVRGIVAKVAPDGKPLLPYRDRYTYVAFDRDRLDLSPKDIAYVINNYEWGLFPAADFNIHTFAYYSVLTPK